MSIVRSLDHSKDITIDDDFGEKFNKLLSDFLKELPRHLPYFPATINLSVKAGADWWYFEAEISDAKNNELLPADKNLKSRTKLL